MKSISQWLFILMIFLMQSNLNAQNTSSLLPSYLSEGNRAKQYFSGSFTIPINSEQNVSVKTYKKLNIEIIGPGKIIENSEARFQIFFFPEKYNDIALADKVFSNYELTVPITSRFPHIAISRMYKSPETAFTFDPSIVMVGEKNSFKIKEDGIKWGAFFPFGYLQEKYRWKDITPSRYSLGTYKLLKYCSLVKDLIKDPLWLFFIKFSLGYIGDAIQKQTNPQKIFEEDYDVYIVKLDGPNELWDNPIGWYMQGLSATSSSARMIELPITFTKWGKVSLNLEFFLALETYEVVEESHIVLGFLGENESRVERSGSGNVHDQILLDIEVERDQSKSESNGMPCPGLPTVTYKGKTYNTVQIGNQCWLKENLDVGKMIHGQQEQTNNGIIEKYCYDNDPVNCEKYGGLYQWAEALQYKNIERTQGVCPNGWHIPDYSEFNELKKYADNCGQDLLEPYYDENCDCIIGRDPYGFSADIYARTFIKKNNDFLYRGFALWSSSLLKNNRPYYLSWMVQDCGYYPGEGNKGDKISIRCIKDQFLLEVESERNHKNLFDTFFLLDENKKVIHEFVNYEDETDDVYYGLVKQEIKKLSLSGIDESYSFTVISELKGTNSAYNETYVVRKISNNHFQILNSFDGYLLNNGFDKITITKGVWDKLDPRCCPSKRKLTSYRWSGKEFIKQSEIVERIE